LSGHDIWKNIASLFHSVHFISNTKAHCNESIILQIETLETTPGFARIQMGTVPDKKGEQVQK
jgi:hypothetical protein